MQVSAWRWAGRKFVQVCVGEVWLAGVPRGGRLRVGPGVLQAFPKIRGAGGRPAWAGLPLGGRACSGFLRPLRLHPQPAGLPGTLPPWVVHMRGPTSFHLRIVMQGRIRAHGRGSWGSSRLGRECRPEAGLSWLEEPVSAPPRRWPLLAWGGAGSLHCASNLVI